jgi:hypothetical protein
MVFYNYLNFSKLSLDKKRKEDIYKFPKRSYNHLKHESDTNEKEKLDTANLKNNQIPTDQTSPPKNKDKSNKASIKNVLIYLKPYFTTGDSKKLLIYSFLMTICSKGLITLVRKIRLFLKY